LGNIERGRQENPTDSLQQRLARLYGLTVEQLRREAGLSEPAPDLTELPDVLIRSINSLPPEDRTKVLDYVRLLQTAAQEKERRRAKVQRDSSQAVEPAEPDQPSQNGRISARVPRLRRAQL
jgi:hypothetical protein